MNDQTYNGWSNYETWNYKLWLDEDYGQYCHWQEVAQEVANDVDEEHQIWSLATLLEADCDEIQEMMELPTTGPFSDLLGHAIGSINWYEIAESILEDIEVAA